VRSGERYSGLLSRLSVGRHDAGVLVCPRSGARRLLGLPRIVCRIKISHFRRCVQGARPNHVGVVIARHKWAGRLEDRDGKLYATQSTGTEQRAAV
jgi:hypothetical protein